jgi:outer membrane translocation and assembly module TamA
MQNAKLRSLALFAFCILHSAFAAAQPLRVGKITINSVDVYSQKEAAKGRFYRAADALHIETRDSVIRKFLLFREGDEYRPERLAETERALRALHFLKSASVTASEPHDGVVDVTVTTQDAWSIAPETQAGNRGGESTYGASITDSNLLGLGKEVSVSWDKTIDRTRLAVDYQDPAINSNFWSTHLAYGHNSDGYDRRFQLRRPFYSFATPWSAEVTWLAFKQDDRLFADGNTIEKFQQEHKLLQLDYGIAMHPSDTRANRITGGIRFIDDRFSSVAQDRRFRYMFARWDKVENEFVKLNFISKDIRYEDFNLGEQTSAEAAISREAAYARVATSSGHAFSDHSFVMPSVAFESRFNGGPQNSIASGNLFFVRRYGFEHPQATVARVNVNYGWRLDRELQFFADGVTGLRGYRVHAFAGERAIVMNLEQRLYLGREILQLASPGVVAFVDAGNATNGGLPQLMRLKVDAGIGIRIGLPRTPKNLLRIDLSYALQRDARGRSGLLLSVSSGQAF